jgi:hypothetical protein
MPVSKHRRKPGGRNVGHSGGSKAPPMPPLPPDLDVLLKPCFAYFKFSDTYKVSFFKATKGQEDAHYALDIIVDKAWRYQAPMRPVSKAEVFRQMAEPIDDDYPGQTAEEAERALAFLVEHGMVEIDGDQITIPARFQQVDKAG